MVQSLEEDLCTNPLVMCSIVSKSLESSRWGLEFWEGELQSVMESPSELFMGLGIRRVLECVSIDDPLPSNSIHDPFVAVELLGLRPAFER